DAGPAADKGDGEQRRHHPPGADAVVEVLDRLVAAVRRQPPLQDVADDGGGDEDGEDAEQEIDEVGMDAHVALPLRAGLSASSASRARARKVSASSPSATCSEGPKVTLHISGTGMNSPLGITRLRFSIQTGTSSSCGRERARW